LWDPKTGAVDSWNPFLLTPRYDHDSKLLASGEGLISGGHANENQIAVTDELFNPATRVFEPVFPQADSRTTASIASVSSVPVIAESLPTPEAIDVPVDARVAIRFSQPVRVTDLNTSTVTLVGPSGVVSGKVVGAEGGMLAFLTPNVELAPGTTYTAFIQGVKDSLGQELPFSTVRFTTHRYETQTAGQAQSNLAIWQPAPKPVAAPVAVAAVAMPAAAKVTLSVAKPVADAQKADNQKKGAAQEEAEDWLPGEHNRHGQWRVLGLAGDPALGATALTTVPLSAPTGQSGIAGHVVRLNGKPLAGVAVSVGKIGTVTDAAGRFLLANVGSGSQQLLVDGTVVMNNGRHYTKHYIHVDVGATQTTVLSNPIYLLRVDPSTETAISSPASQEIVLTHAAIPGLEVHIPKGTVLREANGKIVTKVSITPVPVDRAPYPTPGSFSAYFTLQPGGAFVDGDASKAIKVIYPNYLGLAPGAKLNFYNYDPSGSGWRIYGHGTVTKDGKQVTPDNDAGFRQIMGFGLGIDGTAPSPGPKPGGCVSGGDPVDCATGFFTHTETDMTLPDSIPISVTRTYMSNDTVVHAFGLGTNLTYAVHLYTPNSNTDVYIVMSDGSQIHYTLQSTSPYIWKNLDSPTPFYGSVMQYVPGVNGQVNLTQDLITVTLTDKTVLTFASDSTLSQLMRIADANGNTVEITLSGGRFIQFQYDSCNRVTQATDNLNRIVKYSYTAPTTVCTGGLYQVTDQNNNSEYYFYDASNRLQYMNDKNTNRVFYNVYNTANQVTNQTLADGAVWQFGYSLVGGIETTTVTDPRLYVRQDTFNASGYLTQEILAMGKSEQQTYTLQRYSSNLVQFVTDQLGRKTNYIWDAYGKLTSVVKLFGTANAVAYGFAYDPIFHKLSTYTDPLSHQTLLAYDSFGNLNKVTNALSNSWVILNNSAGLPTSITDPLTHASQIGYEQADVSSVTDALGRKSNLFTDEVGRVLTASDPIGNTFQYGYDPRDQLLNVTDPNNGVTNIAYDANGNVKTVKDPRNLASHGYTPDSRNRVHIYTDPLGKSATYNYDGMGNLISKLDRKGQLTQYAYDGINRLHVITYSDSSTLTITWDGGNRPTNFADTVNGTIGRGYDGLDQLLQETGPQGTINYTYDAAGRRQNVTIAGEAQPIVYGFDNANRLKSITQGTNVVGWNYDAANRFTGVTLPNGIASTVTPNAANETSTISYDKGATHIADATYTYDADGHRSGASGTLVRPLLDANLSGTTYDAGNHRRCTHL
jgi:YD repeat-containing protein